MLHSLTRYVVVKDLKHLLWNDTRYLYLVGGVAPGTPERLGHTTWDLNMIPSKGKDNRRETEKFSTPGLLSRPAGP